jgi:hypothetical protein
MPEEQEKVSNTDALKALAFDAVNRDLHPDQRATLEIWLDQNLSDQEKDDRLTDDEFVEKHGKTRTQYASDQAASPAPAPAPAPDTSEDESEDDTEETKPRTRASK